MRFKAVRKWVFLALTGVCLALLCGCNTIAYYSQAARGQYQVLASQERIDRLLENPRTEQKLKEHLALLMRLRAFAETHLDLPVDGHYKKYADLGRPYVVWNVEAAPEFSMEPRSWWYPFVGSLEYRGYFSEKAARKYAAALKAKGYDVHVGGVTAYSTLGWFKDPALNTFIFDPELELAETIFHELGHQEVFAAGDKEFNEAFATVVGREGVRRWIRVTHDEATYKSYQQRARREDDFAELITSTKQRLEQLYGDYRDEDGKTRRARKPIGLTREELLRRKAEIFADLQARYAAVKANWGGEAGYDGWFSRSMSNARLNSVAAYHELVPAFEKLLELNNADLKKFYGAVHRLSDMDKDDRHRWLRTLGDLQKDSHSETTASLE